MKERVSVIHLPRARCAFRMALAGLLIAASAAHADPSAREKWLSTANRASPTWSREGLWHEVLGQTKLETRDQAVALLGPPDLTRIYYFPAEGLDEQIDEYRLTATNTRVLHLVSRADGKLFDPTTDDQGCLCPSCLAIEQAAGPVLPGEIVARYLATLKGEPNRPVLVGAIERAVGRPGLTTAMRGMVGGRDWASIEVAWRIADDPHRFLIVWGTTPFRDHPEDEDMPITYFTKVTLSDLCLAP